MTNEIDPKAVPFNGLSPAEAERLALLAEECGEVILAIGKVLRHGYNSFNPFKPDEPNNRQQLAIECGHVLSSIDRMTDAGNSIHAGDLDLRWVMEAKFEKRENVKPYLHHQL